MIDATFVVADLTFGFNGGQYEVVKAGIANGKPYAETAPRNSTVEECICRNILMHMPLPFTPTEVQNDLRQIKVVAPGLADAVASRDRARLCKKCNGMPRAKRTSASSTRAETWHVECGKCDQRTTECATQESAWSQWDTAVNN